MPQLFGSGDLSCYVAPFRSVGQCECERVCSIHKLACCITSIVMIAILWIEAVHQRRIAMEDGDIAAEKMFLPPSSARQVNMFLQERAWCKPSSRTERLSARASAQWTGTIVFYQFFHGVVFHCLLMVLIVRSCVALLSCRFGPF